MEITKEQGTFGSKLEVRNGRNYKEVLIEELEKLDKSFYKKWRDALLSGDYKQGSYALCEVGEPSEYCCLGVIAKVYGYTDNIIKDTGYLTVLQDRLVRTPKEVRRNIRINHFFAGLNDSLELSFEEIAEVLDFIIDNNLYK